MNRKLGVGVAVCGAMLLATQPASAGNGRGTAAVVGFAAGAIAGTLLSPPPRTVIVHPRGPGRYDYGYGRHRGPYYGPYPPRGWDYPPGYFHEPPVVHQQIIYRDVPVPYQQAPAPLYVNPPAPVGSPAPAPLPAPQVVTPNSNAPAVTRYAQPVATPEPRFYPPPQPGQPKVGTVVDRLPTQAMRTEINGAIYFEQEGVFYLPIRIGNEGKYVVVAPR